MPTKAVPDLVTQTVYGFLDFTTTIGNTVMVFSPQSAPPPGLYSISNNLYPSLPLRRSLTLLSSGAFFVPAALSFRGCFFSNSTLLPSLIDAFVPISCALIGVGMSELTLRPLTHNNYIDEVFFVLMARISGNVRQARRPCERSERSRDSRLEEQKESSNLIVYHH